MADMIVLTKEMEKSIRDAFENHDPSGVHTQEFKHCENCVILILLGEIDRLRAENMHLRVNP